MNILFFARRFYPDIGGVEKHVLEISKRLVATGHTVTVVSEATDQVALPKKYLGINIVKIDVGRDEKKKKIVIWQWLWQNRQLLASADIVHCHDVFYWYLPFRFLFPQKPVFTTFHGYESYPIKKSAIVVRKISEKLSWGNICIGDFIPKWYGTTPTFVSYGAVDNFFSERAVASRRGLPSTSSGKNRRESAVFFGRLDEQTGIVTYLKAFEILKKNNLRFKFLVIGDGKYKKQISKKTKVIGFQKNPERYFQEYQFAFVSRYLSILEAFAAKRLVFAVYDNPVKEDYLRMAPFAKWIVTPNNEKQLAEKVLYYLKNPQEEKKMINAAYEWVKEQSWEKFVSVYLALWKRK